MGASPEELRPKARRDELIVIKLQEELLIYDLSSDEAHCLGYITAQVWKHCNGQNTVTDIFNLTQDELRIALTERVVSEDAIWGTLILLARAGLLQGSVIYPQSKQLTRRGFIRSAAAVGATIATVNVSTPAQANSCVSSGGSCVSHAQCCTNNCFGGTCS